MNVFTWWMIRRDIISHISPDLLFNSRLSHFLRFVCVIYLPKCGLYISISNVCNRLPMSSLLGFLSIQYSPYLFSHYFSWDFIQLCMFSFPLVYLHILGIFSKMLTLHFLCWFPVKLLNVCILLKLILFISRKNYLYKNNIISDIWTFFEK